MNGFSDNLKRLRKARNLNQEELAQKLHVTRQTVSGWETGRCQPDIEMLTALAQALDADLHELIYGTKPGEYPRFQRRYVFWTAVCGGLAVLAAIYWIWILPVFQRYCNSFYLPYASNSMFFVPQIGWFCAGAVLPAALGLVHPICLPEKRRKIYWVAGLVLGLPALLVGLDMILMLVISEYPQFFIRLFIDLLLRSSGRAVLLIILPFLSGVLTFLGWNRE